MENQIKQLREVKKKRTELIQKLKISKQWHVILDAFGDFMVTKIYRRYAQLLAVHHMAPVLKEIARRHDLTEKQARFMLPSEMKTLLLKKSCDESTLFARTRGCVYYAEKGYETIFIGTRANAITQKLDRTISKDVTELRGDTGCGGYGKGRVKIIIRAEDMDKMREGDVLVSIATDPDIVPAMKRAAAIITEQGGVTSHAAIVSRELRIPCVIGTKIATRVLRDGDMVEVDANQGIVKIIEKTRS